MVLDVSILMVKLLVRSRHKFVGAQAVFPAGVRVDDVAHLSSEEGVCIDKERETGVW